ncbi:MAG TPA: hypothetical protein VFE47_05500 [Tepidisphaeraceae bacterium]|jgi:hypothetical protein|nr:hypothetical protein [Tepidisphaeraceae bacterium]
MEAKSIIGKEVRIDPEGRVRVGGAARGWTKVPYEYIHFNEYYANVLIAFGRHYNLQGTGLDFRSASRLLGVPRIDGDVAREIWEAPDSLCSDVLAINFRYKELVYRFGMDATHNSTGPVTPFSAYSGIATDGKPRLVSRAERGSTESLAGFQIAIADLAERMRLPILPG